MWSIARELHKLGSTCQFLPLCLLPSLSLPSHPTTHVRNHILGVSPTRIYHQTYVQLLCQKHQKGPNISQVQAKWVKTSEDTSVLCEILKASVPPYTMVSRCQSIIRFMNFNPTEFFRKHTKTLVGGGEFLGEGRAVQWEVRLPGNSQSDCSETVMSHTCSGVYTHYTACPPSPPALNIVAYEGARGQPCPPLVTWRRRRQRKITPKSARAV